MSGTKSEAVKKFAPILEKETANAGVMEWFRYTGTIQQITTSITGFELNSEQAEGLKKKMSEETRTQLSRDSVCQLTALNVRTNESSTVTVTEESGNGLTLNWTLEVGKTIDFDFTNTFWKDDDHNGCDSVFYAINEII